MRVMAPTETQRARAALSWAEWREAKHREDCASSWRESVVCSHYAELAAAVTAAKDRLALAERAVAGRP